MIHSDPRITPELEADLGRLDELRRRLATESRRPARWLGSLRRFAKAKAVESSTSIEGFGLPIEEAVVLVTREEPPASEAEAEQAVACYAQAMDHVATMADDPEFEWSKRVILDLHFEACYFQPDRSPGRWRTGPVAVTGPGGRIDYRGPLAEAVPQLMAEAVGWLKTGAARVHPVIGAAMAHLHVVSIHPFRDGNGRISRIMQSLVLAREGLLAPEFASIEEWLGEHTADYYAALNRAHGPEYDPTLDATEWVSFCVQAHLEQAQRRLTEFRLAAQRWQALEALVAQRGWPDRLVIALERALTGYLNRSGYVAEAQVSLPTGNLDIRRLLDAGLIVQQGRGRVSRYVASDHLSEAAGQPPSAS